MIGDFSSHVAEGGAGESEIFSSVRVGSELEGAKQYSSNVGLCPDSSNLYIVQCILYVSKRSKNYHLIFIRRLDIWYRETG